MKNNSERIDKEASKNLAATRTSSVIKDNIRDTATNLMNAVKNNSLIENDILIDKK